METDRTKRLKSLYAEIHDQARRFDDRLQLRVVVPAALQSKVFLVAQALAQDTQRLSGLPYTLPGGRLSGGGRELDQFLGRFDYTIRPDARDRQFVYASDLVHWFPGRQVGRAADIVPSEDAISRCWGWLEQEIRLVGPEILVALGLPAAKELLSRYAGVRVGTRSPKLKDLADHRHAVVIDGRELPLFVVYHPSRAWQFKQAGPTYDWTASQIAVLLQG